MLTKQTICKITFTPPGKETFQKNCYRKIFKCLHCLRVQYIHVWTDQYAWIHLMYLYMYSHLATYMYTHLRCIYMYTDLLCTYMYTHLLNIYVYTPVIHIHLYTPVKHTCVHTGYINASMCACYSLYMYIHLLYTYISVYTRYMHTYLLST